MSIESIIKELPEDFIRKMRNWAMSKAGGGQYAMSTVFAGMGCGDSYTSHIPILNGEAYDVDNALATVDNRYRQAVMLFWQYEGRPIRWLGRRLMVESRTVEDRIKQGHALLRDALATRTRRVHQYQAHADTLHQPATSSPGVVRVRAPNTKALDNARITQ